MGVPAAVVDLDEAHAALDQAARHEGAVGEAPRLVHLRTVHGAHLRGLALEVGQLGDAPLHAEGHLELLDPGVGLEVPQLSGGDLVEAPHAAEQLSTAVGIRRSLAVSVEIAIME